MRKKGLIIAVAVIVIFVFLAAAIGKGQKNTGEKAKASSPVLFKSFCVFRCTHGA